MHLVICPGLHPPDLTQQFLASLPWSELGLTPRVVPADTGPIYSPGHVFTWCSQHLSPLHQPLFLIAFSAGGVGAIGAAHLWQRWGRSVAGLVAIDGWGVPLWAPFPTYRLSHDAFTDWSSSLLGQGCARFYAEPAVAHLDLWRSPQTVSGWQRQPIWQPTTAAQFLWSILMRHPHPSTSGLYL